MPPVTVQPTKSLDSHSSRSSALDVHHFFEKRETNRICKQCEQVFYNFQSPTVDLHAFRHEYKELDDKEKWDKKRRYLYSATTATGTLRGHLERYHEQEVILLCQRKGWPIQLPKYKLQHSLAIQGRVQFSQEAILDCLVKFIAVNDQVVSFARLMAASLIQSTLRVSTLLKAENSETYSRFSALTTLICPIGQKYVLPSLRCGTKFFMTSKPTF